MSGPLSAFPLLQRFVGTPRDAATHYTPVTGIGLALVVYVRGEPGSDGGYVETITHRGDAIEYAFDFDRFGEEQEWAHALARRDAPDGVYVLTCSWHWCDDDTELWIDEIRPLNAEERAVVRQETALEAVVHAWMRAWADVRCRHCGQLGSAHHHGSDDVWYPCPRPEEAPCATT